MKYLLLLAAMILIMNTGCRKSDGELSEKFPDCVGVEESFDPYNIQKAYNGRIWSQDTSFSTQFIFTEYKYDLSILSKSWVMYFKRNTGPYSYSYQSAWCFRSGITDYWFANTAFDFNGQYTTWNFYFEEFDCSELSGFCKVIRPDIPDTTDFYFAANR